MCCACCCRWLSLLNCFSGGVFLAAGLVHLLPHCAESQARLGAWIGDYPLYLVLITLGYMLVLFVERVLFDVHGSAHGHGPHTGIAPPCVDCRTAEDDMVPGSSSDDLAGDSSAEEAGGHQQGRGGDALNGLPLTPGQQRYNFRSRGGTAAGETAAAAGLRKPLLAGEVDAAAEDGSGPAAAAVQIYSHDRSHSHGHHQGHPSHQHHSHGHLAPLHHHAVVVGDLRQGVVLLVAMVVHTFLECMALGLMVSNTAAETGCLLDAQPA